jgi:hypothetical protein
LSRLWQCLFGGKIIFAGRGLQFLELQLNLVDQSGRAL